MPKVSLALYFVVDSFDGVVVGTLNKNEARRKFFSMDGSPEMINILNFQRELFYL